jgi:hypothetical protein
MMASACDRCLSASTLATTMAARVQVALGAMFSGYSALGASTSGLGGWTGAGPTDSASSLGASVASSSSAASVPSGQSNQARSRSRRRTRCLPSAAVEQPLREHAPPRLKRTAVAAASSVLDAPLTGISASCAWMPVLCRARVLASDSVGLGEWRLGCPGPSPVGFCGVCFACCMV